MRKKWQLGALILLVALAITSLCSCEASTTSNPLSSEGSVTENSGILDVTLAPAQIVMDEGLMRIVYAITVKNISQIELKQFTTTIQLDQALDPYLAAGVVATPLGTFDLSTEKAAREGQNLSYGVDCTYGPMLYDKERLAESNLNYEDCLELGTSLTLHFEWDGGSETHAYTVDVVDKTTDS